jgi:hypothetical protein
MSLQVGDPVLIKHGWRPQGQVERVSKRTPMYVDVLHKRYSLRTGRSGADGLMELSQPSQEDLDWTAALAVLEGQWVELGRMMRRGLGVTSGSAAQLRAAAEAIGAAVRALRGEP